MGTTACEAKSVSGSAPMTMAIGRSWPISSAMVANALRWRGRINACRRRPSLTWMRWIDTFCAPVFGFLAMMTPAVMYCALSCSLWRGIGNSLRRSGCSTVTCRMGASSAAISFQGVPFSEASR